MFIHFCLWLIFRLPLTDDGMSSTGIRSDYFQFLGLKANLINKFRFLIKQGVEHTVC